MSFTASLDTPVGVPRKDLCQNTVEEMKCNHFYKGLNPKYQQMLAHKVDGKHPASYSNLLLAKQKLEIQAEARDPLPPEDWLQLVD